VFSNALAATLRIASAKPATALRYE